MEPNEGALAKQTQRNEIEGNRHRWAKWKIQNLSDPDNDNYETAQLLTIRNHPIRPDRQRQSSRCLIYKTMTKPKASIPEIRIHICRGDKPSYSCLMR
jgi:hypothetical protein